MEEIYELNAKIPQKESKIKYNRSIGSRGENMAATRLTENYIFDCYVFGGTTPVFDLILEINDEKHPYFAALQVKTRSTMIARNGKLNVTITHDNIIKLIRLGLPTYLVGVEESTETIYFAPVFDKLKDKNIDYTQGVPITYTLKPGDKPKNIENLIKLKNDIIAYSTSISKRKLLYKTKLKV